MTCSSFACSLETTAGPTSRTWTPAPRAGTSSRPCRQRGLVLKNDPATHLGGFHNAPRRQYCITLSGSAEIRVGGGASRTFVAGDVFLAEDVTGEGHTLTPDNWVRAFVHLDSSPG